jgi:hypothetical protein
VARKARIRVAFVGRFYWHNGSSHALLGYVRAGQRRNYDVRVSALGIFDEIVGRNVPVADREWTPDVMVFVFEERFLREDGFAAAERLVPRARRLVIDPDGKYSEAVAVGNDTNHETADSRRVWSAEFERLSDTILQPRLGSGPPNSKSFLYFGIDVHGHVSRARIAGQHEYDVLYVGNNWYRWHDFVWLLEGLAPVRSQLGRIGVFGQYWSGEPLVGYEEHTQSDPELLRRYGVDVAPSVPFDGVEGSMSRGRVNPVFVRPVLGRLKHVTPRMFETFAADTVPMLPPYLDYASDLYGPLAKILQLPDVPGPAVLSTLSAYSDRLAVAREIREHLVREHCYDVRLDQLLSFVPSA